METKRALSANGNSGFSAELLQISLGNKTLYIPMSYVELAISCQSDGTRKYVERCLVIE